MLLLVRLLQQLPNHLKDQISREHMPLQQGQKKLLSRNHITTTGVWSSQTIHIHLLPYWLSGLPVCYPLIVLTPCDAKTPLLSGDCWSPPLFAILPLYAVSTPLFPSLPSFACFRWCQAMLPPACFCLFVSGLFFFSFLFVSGLIFFLRGVGMGSTCSRFWGVPCWTGRIKNDVFFPPLIPIRDTMAH